MHALNLAAAPALSPLWRPPALSLAPLLSSRPAVDRKRWLRRGTAPPWSSPSWSAVSACTGRTGRPLPKPSGPSRASVRTRAPTARLGTGRACSRTGGSRCASASWREIDMGSSGSRSRSRREENSFFKREDARIENARTEDTTFVPNLQLWLAVALGSTVFFSLSPQAFWLDPCIAGVQESGALVAAVRSREHAWQPRDYWLPAR